MNVNPIQVSVKMENAKIRWARFDVNVAKVLYFLLNQWLVLVRCASVN